MQNFSKENSLSNISDKIKNFRFKGFIKTNYKIFLLLTLLVVICYGNSLFNAFVSDDWGIFKINYSLQSIFPDLKAIFSNYPELLFRMVLINTKLTTPFFFRLPNVLSHLGSVYLIFIITSIIINKKTALFTSALFAIHPILIESVTWISGAPYVRQGFFFLLSFLLYILSSQNKKYYYFSLVSFYLSLLSSEKAIPLFLIFPLYEICFGNLKKNWLKTLPFFLLSSTRLLLLLPAVAPRQDSLQNQFYKEKTVYNPLVQIPIAITYYLDLIFWPDKLTLYHSEMSFTVVNYIIRLFIFTIYIGFIIYSFFRQKIIFFGLSFLLISLAVTLNPLGLGWIVAERYVYLGTFGILIIIGFLFEKLSKHNKTKTTVNLIIIFTVLLLSLRTIIRNIDWKNEDNLWLSGIRTSPSSTQNHNNLGDYYSRHGDFKSAIREFQTAINIYPKYADAYHNLAIAYLLSGNKQKAIEKLKQAVTINPRLWQSYAELGNIYAQEKNYSQALEYLNIAYKINPGSTIKNKLDQVKKYIYE